MVLPGLCCAIWQPGKSLMHFDVLTEIGLGRSQESRSYLASDG